jgi:FkbM family methyltransferase
MQEEQIDSRKIYSPMRKRAEVAWGCRQELSNWPNVLIRVALGRLHIRPGVLTVSSRSGLKLSAPNRSEAYQPFFEVLVSDAYRMKSTTWQSPEKPRLVLDIGAHVGSFACSLAALLPGATFVCVEPSVPTTVWLKRNLEQNGLTSRATVLCAAITNVDGPVALWGDGEVSSENSLIAEGKRRQTEVNGLSIESLFAKLERPPDIVKLDCEGGEYAAILGGFPELWKGTNHLFLEYHRDGFPELVRRIEEFGLNLVWHEPSPRFQGLGMSYFARSDG